MTWTHTHGWTLAAEPARVFRALTDPAAVTRWFAEHVEVGHNVGGPYRSWGQHTLGTPDAAESRPTMTGLEAGRALGFSRMMWGTDTEVALPLGPEGDGTRLAVTHRVDGDLPVPRQRELIDDHWRQAIGNLAAHLGGVRGSCCRTTPFRRPRRGCRS